MEEVILRNTESEKYLCAARKNFALKHEKSESDSKTVIVHFTDIHGDIKRFENDIKIIEHINPLFAVHTGDTVTWNTDDEYEFFEKSAMCSNVPIYNCIGNHDTFNNKGIVSNLQLYDMFVKSLKNIKCDDTAYYYVDFQKEKLRLIVINPYESENPETRDKYNISQIQINWMCKILLESAENEMGVIIAAHEIADIEGVGGQNNSFCQRFEPYPWGYPTEKPCVIEDIVDAFIHGKAIDKEYIFKKSDIKVKVKYDFGIKGEFICYLTGHKHGDYSGYLPNYKDQLFFCLTCSGCFPEGYHNIGEECSDLPRIPDTVTEDALNTYVIDRKARSVTVIRYGATLNDMAEKRVCEKFIY